MATVIEINDNRGGYLQVLEAILEDGRTVGSRAGETRELFATTIILKDPYDALPVGIGRKTNVALAALEAMQLVGGFVDVDLLCRIAPNMEQFLDGGRLHGAYGERTRDDFRHLVRRLRETPDTRQAVITIWNNRFDLPLDDWKDYPCTVDQSFYVRDDKLIMHTHMRSNDAWWGWCYDAFQFTQVQLTIANILGIEPGEYVHHVNSLHLYQRDWEAAQDLVQANEIGEGLPFYPRGFTGDSWEDAASRASYALRARVLDNSLETETEQWYQDTIKRRLSLTVAK